MDFWAYDLTPAIRALAFLNVLLLLILYVIINAARKRQERLERKVDLLLLLVGAADKLAEIDQEYGRESGHMPLS
jgi:hypothetical protein